MLTASRCRFWFGAPAILLLAPAAHAQTLDSGHSAWMITATSLVKNDANGHIRYKRECLSR